MMKKKLVLLIIMLIFVTGSYAVDTASIIGDATLIYSDDFETDLSNWTTTINAGGEVSLNSSVFKNGTSSLRVTKATARTRTLSDDPGVDVFGGIYRTVWTEFWVYMVNPGDWYNTLPIPEGETTTPAFFAAARPSSTSVWDLTMRTKQTAPSDGTTALNMTTDLNKDQWYHFLIGFKIDPNQDPSDPNSADGSYSVYIDENDTWTALAEDESAWFHSQPPIGNFGRIRIWSNNGDMYIDDLNVYAADEAGVPDFCGDIGTIYNPYDFNGDCYVDLADFAVFAVAWLECTDPTRPDICIEY